MLISGINEPLTGIYKPVIKVFGLLKKKNRSRSKDSNFFIRWFLAAAAAFIYTLLYLTVKCNSFMASISLHVALEINFRWRIYILYTVRFILYAGGEVLYALRNN